MLPKDSNKIFSFPSDISYLNCAYMGPLTEKVITEGHKGVQQKQQPYNVLVKDFFEPTESLRKEFAKLIQTKEHNRIVIIPSVSYGIATVAKNIKIKKGQKIILAGEQFPSNVYSWKNKSKQSNAKLITINPPKTPKGRAKKWNEKILNAIDTNTKVVSISHVHWSDGSLFNLHAIRKKTKDVGALLIIDGTQSVGALPINISELKPDALICAGYKWLLGPYSIGLAWYGDYFDNGIPIEENWINRAESENFSQLVNYTDSYQSGSLRYEVGEHSNFILVPMLKAAIEQINDWGVENIQDYCKKLTAKPIIKLKELGCKIENKKHRGHHLFGIRLAENINPEKLKKEFQKNQIYVSFRGNAIRISPHIYNTKDDFDKLVFCFKKALI